VIVSPEHLFSIMYLLPFTNDLHRLRAPVTYSRVARGLMKLSTCVQLRTSLVAIIGVLSFLPALRADELESPSALGAVNDRIAAMRGELKVSEATRKRVEERLAVLEQMEDADPEILRLYRLALGRLKRLEQDQRADVARMEQLHGVLEEEAPLVLPPDFQTNPFEGVTLPTREEYDEAMKLEKELEEAFGDFDRLLLKNQIEVEEKLAKAEQAGGAAGGGASGGGASGGGAAGGGASGGAEAAGGTQTASGAQTGTQGGGQASAGEGREVASGTPPATGAGEQADSSAGGRPMPSGEQTASAGEGTRGGESGSGAQRGAGAGTRVGAEDDDIVARQLREAAEAETDPVLKERLWKEYEAYKGVGR